MKDVIISVMLTPTEPTPPKGYRIVGFGIRGLCNTSEPTLTETVARASKQFGQTTQLACYAVKHEDDVMVGEWDETEKVWKWKDPDDLINPFIQHT